MRRNRVYLVVAVLHIAARNIVRICHTLLLFVIFYLFGMDLKCAPLSFDGMICLRKIRLLRLFGSRFIIILPVECIVVIIMNPNNALIVWLITLLWGNTWLSVLDSTILKLEVFFLPLCCNEMILFLRLFGSLEIAEETDHINIFILIWMALVVAGLYSSLCWHWLSFLRLCFWLWLYKQILVG